MGERGLYTVTSNTNRYELNSFGLQTRLWNQVQSTDEIIFTFHELDASRETLALS